MNKLKSITVVVMVLITLNAKSQTANDSIQIKQAALDYIDGWYYRDAARVDKATIASVKVVFNECIGYLITR